MIVGLALIVGFRALAFVTRKVAFQQNSQTTKNTFKLDRKDLVGKFYSGDGLGRNEVLLVNTDGSYDYKNHGCLGLYNSAAGSWRIDGDVIKFEELRDDLKRFVPVKWGLRIYLFSEKDIEHRFDLLFKFIAFRPNDTHGFSYVKEPLPPLMMKDFDSDPIMPDRYKELWNKTKAKYKETYKDLPDRLEFLTEENKAKPAITPP